MKRHDKGLACHGHAAMGNMPWTSMTVTLGSQEGWIVRSHISWRGEQNIPYKGVKTSP